MNVSGFAEMEDIPNKSGNKGEILRNAHHDPWKMRIQNPGSSVKEKRNEEPSSRNEHLELLKEKLEHPGSSIKGNPYEEPNIGKEHIESVKQMLESLTEMNVLPDRSPNKEEILRNAHFDPWEMRIESPAPSTKENPNEEPNLRKKHLKSFKQRLECENIQCRKDDMFLLSFLRASKFDQDRAFNCLTKYYSTRKSYPEIYGNFTPKDYQHILESRMFRILPKPDKLGRTIFLIKHESEEVLPVSIKEFVAVSMMILGHALQREDVQKNGIILIYDSKDLPLGFVLEATPRMINASVTSFFGAFPLRYKEIHYVNTLKLFQVLFLLAKPFLPKKVVERMRFHGYSWESVHEHIGKDLLPKDVGGSLEDDKHEELITAILEQQEMYEKYKEYWNPEGTTTKT